MVGVFASLLLGGSLVGVSIGLGDAGGAFFSARQRGDVGHRALVDLDNARLFVVLRAAQPGRERRVRRAIDLDRVLDDQPAARRTGHRALDEQQPARGVGVDDLEVLLGAVAITHVTGHFLVLEDAARILPVTRRAVRAVRTRVAVGGWATTEAGAEERRVGKACVRTCRSRWWRYHKKNNKKE